VKAEQLFICFTSALPTAHALTCLLLCLVIERRCGLLNMARHAVDLSPHVAFFASAELKAAGNVAVSRVCFPR